MNEHYLPILRSLYLLRRIGENDIVLERILGPFTPSGNLSQAKKALEELRRLGLIISPVSEERIAINPDRFNDVIRLLDPEPDPSIKNITPFEESISEIFHKVPFNTTEGSHRVKGITDTYSFHRKRSDPNYIVVFLVSDNQKKNTIHLGSIFDENSLYRRTVKGIDEKFQNRVFTKAMMNELGKDIVGNRQPPKALIDMMKYDGYVIFIDDQHFQRTSKQIPPSQNLQRFFQDKENLENNKEVTRLELKNDSSESIESRKKENEY